MIAGGPNPPDETWDVQRFGLALSDSEWVDRVRGAFAAPAPHRIGRFEILGELPRGGQGVVYRVRDTHSRQIVALKRMTSGSLASDKERFRFEREVEAAQSLHHPHIVRVLGMEIISGQSLIAMEWVDGVPIDQWAQSRPAGSSRSVRERLSVFLKVCDAVRHAHQRGVIHRDLKPANILVTTGINGENGAERAHSIDSHRSSLFDASDDSALGESAEPKLLDFGIAKFLAPEASVRLTGSKDFLGTPAYAAPEQIDGRSEAVDVRTDVYSLGVVLYEILTGRLPFDPAFGMARLFDSIRSGEFPPPSRLAPHFNGELDSMVLKAMAREPSQRYQSVDALVADGQRYLAGEPLDAGRGQRWLAIQKQLRRHRMALITSGLTIGLLASGSTGLSLLYSRQRAATSAMTAARDAESAARNAAERSQAALAQLLFNIAESGRGAAIVLRRTLLSEAERSTEAELRDSPGALAAARDAIGRTYQVLGQYDDAQRVLTSALDVRVAALGRSHPDTAASIRNLAGLLQDRSLYAAAKPLYQEAAAIRLARFGANHLSAADSLHDQGIIASNEHDFAAALRAYSMAAELRAQLLGPTHADTIDSREAVAYAHANLDAHELAAAEMQIVLSQTIAAYGEQHRKTAGRYVGLGKFLALSGRTEEAEAHLRRGLELYRLLLGDQHDNVAWAAHRLGNLLAARGAIVEAEPLLLEALAIYRTAVGADSPFAGFVCESLAELYAKSGCTLDAAELLAEARRIEQIQEDGK